MPLDVDMAIVRGGRDEAEAACLRQLAAYNIPDGLHGGLIRYLVAGIRPGSFLSAVLENDLQEAVVRANPPEHFAALPALVLFLFNEAPSHSWGSPEKVALWSARQSTRLESTR